MAVPTQGHAGQWNPWNRNFFPRGIVVVPAFDPETARVILETKQGE